MKKSIQILLFIATVLLVFEAKGQQNTAKSPDVVNSFDRKFFIENRGQWHSDVLYLCRMGGLDAWITKYGVNYTFFKLEKAQPFSPLRKYDEHGHLPDKFEHQDYTLIGHRVLMKLQDHNPEPVREGKQRQEGYYNYFIGNDEAKHATYVGLYKEAIVKSVYEGIDLRYYFDNGNLRYDYIVHPYADPSQIVFTLEGSDKTYINSKGNLVFTTRFGEVAMAELKTYQAQDKKEVKSRFVQRNGKWGIDLANYDKTQVLIIDPLVYSTYIGGSSDDVGYGIAVDGSGSAYVTGFTSSTNYDVTAGAFQTTYGGGPYDVFVTKLNATGTALVYSTYIGGSNHDIGYGIAVDGSGSAYVTGWATSGYDVTAGAFQTSNEGSFDVFVTKLNATGTALVYSTYIGGSGDDYGFGIAVDGSGSAYVTGRTQSINYDVTAGAFQTTHGGGTYDVFVTKLNATGTALVYSTYIGGSSQDQGFGIAVDGSGSAYVTGRTQSTNYDVTAGAFQTSNGGTWDVFVTKLNAMGTALVYSTYIGGSGDDVGYGIAVDGSGSAYVMGWTISSDYDVTAGVFQTSNGGSSDVFVTKLNATGTALVYSTYIGGSSFDEGYGIAVDGSGSAYVTGLTYSSDYDVTAGAFQTSNGGGLDVFVTKLWPGALPIQSITLTGQANSNYNSLQWQVETNELLKAYTLQRYHHATKEWQDVATLLHQSGQSIYVYQDKSYPVKENTLLYRVQGRGKDGGSLYSNVIEITPVREEVWSVYPNPNRGNFTLQNAPLGVYEVIEPTGKVIHWFEVQNTSTEVQLALPAGMYFIRERRTGAMRKFVVW
jgi:hypothetical protein